MPKFLDAPSWYDSNGIFTEAQGVHIITLSEEDYVINDMEYTATATVNVVDLSAGTNVKICVPQINLSGVTIYRISIIGIDGQAADTVLIQYSIAYPQIYSSGIEFFITSHSLDMNGKTLVFKNASIYSYTSYDVITLNPTIGPSPSVVVMINGALKKPVYTGGGVLINQFNGANPTYSSPSFYAPTESGTAGQYLISGGSGVEPTWKTLELPSAPSIFTIGSASSTMLSTILPESGFAIVWNPDTDGTIGIKSVNYKNLIFIFRAEVVMPANWFWYGIDNSGNWRMDSYNSSITVTASDTTLYYVAFQNRN